MISWIVPINRELALKEAKEDTMGELIHLQEYLENRFNQVFAHELSGLDHLLKFLVEHLSELRADQVMAEQLVLILKQAFEKTGIVLVTEEAVVRLGVVGHAEQMQRLKAEVESRYEPHFSRYCTIFLMKLGNHGVYPSERNVPKVISLFYCIYAMFVGLDFDPRQESEDTRATAGA